MFLSCFFCILEILKSAPVVSPNSGYREFYHEILKSASSLILVPCSEFVSSNVGVVWGGGGCNVFLTFYAISNISRKKIWEYKTIISHLMFSSCFFCMLEILKSAPVVSPNSGYREFYHEILKSASSLTG